jgi:hypothetical protein
MPICPSMLIKRYPTVLAALLLCASPAMAGMNCTLKEFASLPVTVQTDGTITVPLKLSGVEYPFAVDLDISDTAANQSLTDELKMDMRDLPEGISILYAHQQISHAAYIPDLLIGVIHATRVRVLVLPQSIAKNSAGVVGLDILSKFDLEVDLEHNRLNLFSQEHCDGQGVYWADSAAVLPFKTDQVGHTTFNMTLDGKPLNTSFSTLTASGRMGMSDANDLFGLSTISSGMSPLSAAQSDEGKMDFRYPFKTLSLGGVTVNNPEIKIYPQKPEEECNGKLRQGKMCVGGSQLRLGLSEIRALHLFFAFGEKKLYATAADAHR